MRRELSRPRTNRRCVDETVPASKASKAYRRHGACISLKGSMGIRSGKQIQEVLVLVHSP